MQISDGHMGAVQIASEIENFNEFNPEICRSRQLTYAQKFVEWVQMHRSAYTIPECAVLVTGDLMCFPKGTPITLHNGCVKPINEVKEGDTVLSFPEPRKVMYVHCRESKPEEILLKVKICKSIPITATKEHIVKRLPREKIETGWNPGGKRGIPFQIRDKKIELFESDFDDCSLGNIRVGDYVVVSSYRPTNGSESLNIRDITGLDLTEKNNELFKKVRGTSPAIISNNTISIDNDLLWLIGIFLAEGSFQKGRSGCINSAIFTLNINEDFLSDKICKIVKSKFGYTPSVYLNKNHNVRNVWVSNQIIATLLYKLCGGRYCYTKVISEHIYNSPNSLLPLIGGWIDGDAGLSKQRGSLVGVTVNQNLARQISTILWSERISHGVCEDTHGRHRVAYRISITGEYAQNIASYTESYKNTLFKPGYEDGIWVGSCYCLRIMSKNEVKYSGKLYDLTIDGNHYYQVNGVVVHNSGDIHDELKITNAFPSPVQVVKAAEVLAEQMAIVAQVFKKVTVHFISEDNHARLVKKPQAKEAGYNSLNYLVGYLAKVHLAAHSNVEFNIYPMYEKVVKVGSQQYLICHGHGVMGWGGIPFYGIERKVGKESVSRMQIMMSDLSRAKEIGFHKYVFGHWHTPFDMPLYSCCGSIQGTDAYDHKNGRHAFPSQVSWLVHPKHGEFDRINFNLR